MYFFFWAEKVLTKKVLLSKILVRYFRDIKAKIYVLLLRINLYNCLTDLRVKCLVYII